MKVEDVMTRRVLTVPPDSPLKDVAALLVDRGISGVPVVDSHGEVLGVVSETDILYKERKRRSKRRRLLTFLFYRDGADVEAKVEAQTAGEAMSSPAITIRPDVSVSWATAVMTEQGVNRLIVLDDEKLFGEIEDGDLVGIVTRADFVRAFARSDEAIADEIQSVLAQENLLMLGKPDFAVNAGEVILEGETNLRGDAELLVQLVREVPGVVSIDSRLSWRMEESELPPEPPRESIRW